MYNISKQIDTNFFHNKTTTMVQIIILLAIISWYSLGFLPRRRINKENQHLHGWGVGNRTLGYVDGDKGLPWTSLPWPFKKTENKNLWSQPILGALPTTNSIGKTITYGTAVEITGLPYKIVTASDKSNKVRKNSLFMFRFTVRFPEAGVSFEVVLRTVFHVFNPMGQLKLEGNILDYAQGEIDDAIEPWFVQQEQVQKRIWEEKNQQSVDPLTEKTSLAIHMIQWMEQFRIDDVEKIIIVKKTTEQEEEAGATPVPHDLNFKTYLEVRKFNKFGFKFKELSLQLGYGDSVVKILEERQKQQQAAEETNTNIKKEKAKAILRVSQINDATANATAKQTEWTVTEKILEKIRDAQVAVNQASKVTTLVNNGGGTQNSFLDAFSGALIGATSQHQN